ncbi:hypothetical protein [Halapricum hydrolyticum]|uniref:Uncharacterized protein n=1 Tax=Halapricum hydrolyticum TaxID=2979991 RepID=A0AAE3IH23_9EURY|nr:hypothetical protein [Halapricum hydrolyticum]MCU4719276.1 hypothetical protein [Halapricum hydrolyticum]MCU4728539.1 hypothetical protein [Halapricum hydrolyticum]
MAAQEDSGEDRVAGVTIPEPHRVIDHRSVEQTTATSDESPSAAEMDCRWIEAMRERLRRETAAEETFVWTDEDDRIAAFLEREGLCYCCEIQ